MSEDLIDEDTPIRLIHRQHRRKPPTRRPSQSFDFSVKGRPYHAVVGYYPGTYTPCDVFLYAGKAGSDTSITMLEASISLSFAFQFGARASDVRSAMPHDGRGEGPGDPGEPEGPIGTLLTILAREEAKDIRKELSE